MFFQQPIMTGATIIPDGTRYSPFHECSWHWGWWKILVSPHDFAGKFMNL